MRANVKAKLHHLIAAFWAVFSVVWLMMPAAQGVIPAKAYFVISAVMVPAFVWAWLTRQRGLVR